VREIDDMTTQTEVPCRKVWAMPAANGDTFLVPQIRAFIDPYLKPGAVVVDPFARNCKLGTITNDLNPATEAQYHMDSVDFLLMLEKQGTKADVVLFDPPYSPRQIKELYDSIGLKTCKETAHRSASWKNERDVITRIMKPGGVVLSFGWNTLGMGKKRGFIQKEILVVCHGAAHNDTLCVADQRDDDLFV